MKPDIVSEARFLPPPPAVNATVRGFLSEYRHPVWYIKTRMVWPPDGEKISKISLFVLTECTNVTDRHTDTAWRHRLWLCIASCGTHYLFRVSPPQRRCMGGYVGPPGKISPRLSRIGSLYASTMDVGQPWKACCRFLWNPHETWVVHWAYKYVIHMLLVPDNHGQSSAV